MLPSSLAAKQGETNQVPGHTSSYLQSRNADAAFFAH